MLLSMISVFDTVVYRGLFDLIRTISPKLISIFVHCPAETNPASLACHEHFVWVSKWVDYSNKYGFGYQLSNHSIGVLFNDGTHMSLSADWK